MAVDVLPKISPNWNWNSLVSSYWYEPRPDRNAELREALVKLARQKPRYGYRRLHALLSRRGHEVNVKHKGYVLRGQGQVIESKSVGGKL